MSDNAADIYKASGGAYDPNGYGIVNYGANLAKQSVKEAYGAASGLTQQYYNTATGQITDAYKKSILQYAPQQEASYSLLDKALDLLGVSRYSGGSSQYKKDLESMKGFEGAQAQLQNAMSQKQTLTAELNQLQSYAANPLSKFGKGLVTIPGTKDVQPIAQRMQTVQQALGALDNQINYFNSQLASQKDLQSKLDSGFTDPATQQAKVQEELMNTPGFQANLNATTKALQSQAASAGLLKSGRTLKAVQQNAIDLASKNYGDTVGMYLNAAGPQGFGAYPTNTANAMQTLGTNQAGLTSQTGTNLSNLAVGQGTDLSNILLGQASALSNIYQSSLLRQQSAAMANQQAANYASGYLGGK